MTPYYSDSAVTIFQGDSRELLPAVEREAESVSIIMDPTWPDAKVPLYGSEDPVRMFAEILAAPDSLPERLAVELGCGSDPRFLMAVPHNLPFFRVAWLEVVRMGYHGRLGHTGDVGYLFGRPPPVRPGARIIPGRCIDSSNNGKQSFVHPCPRKIRHVKWLVQWWSAPDDLVVDPCAGSGTTGVAAKELGRKAVLIEIEERFCEEAARRCEAAQFALNL